MRINPKRGKWVWVFVLLPVLSTIVSAQSFPPGQERLYAGIDFYSQGKWREAIQELRRAQAETNSRELRGETLFWISMAELSAGEYEEALYDMAVLEETDPEHPRLFELGYHRGRALYYLGRYDDAIVFLKRYADSFPPLSDGGLAPLDKSRKAAALYWTGECLFSMGQLDKAREVFTVIAEDYPDSPKYEASSYRLGLINQKKVETELLDLLLWSHEESLRNIEEYRRKESAYDQALSTYQKLIAELLAESEESRGAAAGSEETNDRYRKLLESAEEKIRSLENTLKETSANLENIRSSAAGERLKSIRLQAEELFDTIGGGK